jgi:Flp pilus assembly protein TadD
VKIAWLCAAVALAQTVDHGAALRDAVAAMQRGDFQSAERQLRGEVAAHPDDALALSLLGAALDNLKKFSEAAGFHSRAVAKAPRSTDVLTSYAAHLWIGGNEEEARKVYLRVVALDASHSIANLQLARLALKKSNGPDALRFLDRLPANQRDHPPALPLRLEALYLNGENALKADPASFNVLYDLGLAATYAGHYDRAHEVLDAALRRQPQNVDVLYALGRVDDGLKQ